MVTDKTIVIPGYGRVGGKTEMTEDRDLVVLSIVSWVVEGMKANLGLLWF